MPDPISATIGSAVIGAGTSIFGASQQAKGQDKALKAQTESTNKQLALQKEIFDTNKAGAQPWVDAGKTALETLTTKIGDGSFDMRKYGMEDLALDPGYQFRLKEGQNAMESAAAARGKLISGDQMIGLTKYGQDYASNEYGNAYARASAERDKEYARLYDMSGQGLSAQNAQSGAATNYANSASNIMQTGASAAGNAAINTGGIWANMAGDVAQSANQGISNYLLYQRLGQT